MPCSPPVFLRTFDLSLHGVRTVTCLGDGYTIRLEWHKEYLQPSSWQLYYNLYWSTNQENIYDEGVKLVVRPNTAESYLSMDIGGWFTPGKVYYFAVKGASYEPGTFFYDDLVDADPGQKISPEAALVQDISATDTVIPIDDISGFPINGGIVQIGGELIQYSNIDGLLNTLSGCTRGLYGTQSILTGSSTFVDLGPSPHNVGNGTLTNLSIFESDIQAQVWSIFCSAISLDGYGLFIARSFLNTDGHISFDAALMVDDYGNYLVDDGYNLFISGTEPGGDVSFTQPSTSLDGYANPIVWKSDGSIVSSDVLRFSINQGTVPFAKGDSFSVKVVGGSATAGPSVTARPHTTDGYDGVKYYNNIFVRLWKGWEDGNTAIGMTTIKFTEQYARTNADGYRERMDILSGTGNLNVVDAANAGFPIYDQTGWDRTYLPDYLSGKCIGTYFGGEYGCADGSESGMAVRGLSVQDHMNMREEYLLQITGEPVVLFRRMWSGKQSQHYSSTRENTTYRGLDTYGTSLVTGYEQFFSPRQSDGKILVRFGPTKEDFKREDSGIENSFIPNCWTLVTPVIKDGDFIIRFNQDGSEEWRYEIIDVDRNRALLQESGLQKFTAVRVRKTDPIYQVRSFSDTGLIPSEILTSIGSVPGPGGIPAHMHRCILSEKIMSLNQINQLTSVDQGHNHPIVSGQVTVELGHSHNIIIP